MKTLNTLFLLAILLYGIFPGAAQAQDRELTVATIERPPFVMRGADGALSGFSIELWSRIADDLGYDYEFRLESQFKEMLDKVASSEVDLAVANISITSEREAAMDFSLPIYDSGLQILIRDDSTDTSALTAVFRSAAIQIIAIACFAWLVAAHFMWWFERERNPNISANYVAGVWDSLWWAFIAAADGGPPRPTGVAARLFAMLWILIGVLTVSSLTASITTLFTVSQLGAGVQSYNDLKGKTIGLPAGTTMERFAVERGVPFVSYPDFAATLEALKTGDIDATIGDAPVVRYFALNDGVGVASVAGPVFAPDKIGFAMPSNSPVRDPVNQALLRLIESGAYARLKQRYFGVEDG